MDTDNDRIQTFALAVTGSISGTQPPGAEIYLDGIDTGKMTPLSYSDTRWNQG